MTNAKRTSAKTEITKTVADLVVIGAGSGGLAAGLTASYGGAKVAVIEKMAAPGGLSLFAEGMFAVESALQKRDYVGLTKDEAFKRHMDATQWRANGRLVRAFFDKSADTIDWLQQQGVEYLDAAAMWPDGPRTWHLFKGGGSGLIKALAEKARQSGIRILLNSPATEIKVDSWNRIAGVVAKDKSGKIFEVEAKGVIVAAGGFSSNKKMLEKYTCVVPGTPPLVDMKQTGDPIQMAWAIGAAPEGTSVLMALPSVIDEKPDSHLHAAAVQPGLWINRMGDRFCDESIFFKFPLAANALMNQPDSVMYSIFDEDGKKAMMEEGASAPLGIYVPATTKLVRLDDDIHRGMKKGVAFACDSLRELAEAIGTGYGALQDTVDAYNKHCDENHDGTFAKNTKYLRHVRKGRFYAVQSSLHVFTTLGGIKINHRTEVLDNSHQVIPGLYAVGNCAAGMYGSNYELTHPGEALGFAVNSGRIAGENVLKYLGK